jgi:uncharacterized protein (TIGR00369 family)
MIQWPDEWHLLSPTFLLSLCSFKTDALPKIMKKNLTIDQCNELCKGTLMEHLGMKITVVEEGRVEATMPIDQRTVQPVGILHGGATIALAESVAGIGSYYLCSPEEHAVGMQLSVNHISSPRKGEVKAVALILHQGKKSHIWQVEVFSADNKLVSVITVTNMIIKKRIS